MLGLRQKLEHGRVAEMREELEALNIFVARLINIIEAVEAAQLRYFFYYHALIFLSALTPNNF